MFQQTYEGILQGNLPFSSVSLASRKLAFIRRSSRKLHWLASTLTGYSADKEVRLGSEGDNDLEILGNRAANVAQMAGSLIRALPSLASLPVVSPGMPRVVKMAIECIRDAGPSLSQRQCIQHIKGTRPDPPFLYSELVMLSTSLQLSAFLLFMEKSTNYPARKGQITQASITPLASLIEVLRSFDGEEFIDKLSPFEPLLLSDPACLYPEMDSLSRNIYREAIARLSTSCRLPETVVCQGALNLCSREEVATDKRFRLRSHVGYYLLDQDGIDVLRAYLGRLGIISKVFRRPSRLAPVLALYLSLTVLLAGFAGMHFLNAALPPVLKVLSILCLIIIAADRARNLVFTGVMQFVRPSKLPRLDLRQGIPREYATIVVLPTVLFDAEHVTSVVRRMEAHGSVIRDPNVSIVLLTDFSDSKTKPEVAPSSPLLDKCACLIEDLNNLPAYQTYKPFFLFHRDHRFCKTEARWIGWERKRGKVQDLISYVVRGESHFVKGVGDLDRLRLAKYLVVLDDDSKLTEHAVQDLVGTHVHPLHHPHVDDRQRLLRGYGILEPTIVVHSGTPGTASERLIPKRNLIHDAIEQCSFSGKGILNILAYQQLVDGRIPEGCVLSHDVIEAGFVRTGGASEVVISESVPSTHEIWCKRRHRWVRGDWQNIIFLVKSRSQCPGLSLFGRLLIIENLQNSLVPVAAVILLAAAAMFNNRGLLWLIIVLSAGPTYLEAAMTFISGLTKGERDKIKQACQAMLFYPRSLLRWIGKSAHDAAISMDAIVRTLSRFITKRRLLEWETSAASERSSGATGLCHMYRWVATMSAVLFMVGAAALQPRPVLPILLSLLWVKRQWRTPLVPFAKRMLSVASFSSLRDLIAEPRTPKATMRYAPLARLEFQNAGIRLFSPRADRVVDPHVASILEVFAHNHALEDAFNRYTWLLDVPAEEQALSLGNQFQTDDLSTVLVLAGDQVAICPPQSADRAYQLANCANVYGHSDTTAEALRKLRILNLTGFSRRMPIVAWSLVRQHHTTVPQYPRLSMTEFARVTETLLSEGLLTVPIGGVNFGDLKRRVPFCPDYGFSRGTPIDRHYLEQFIAEIRDDVKGITLEIGGREGNRTRYGFANASDYRVMDLDQSSGADKVADAHDPRAWATDSFDSVILFNVLEHCQHPWVVTENIRLWLRPGGRAFCMVPNAQRIHRDPKDCWRILPDGFEGLFASYRILRSGTYGNLVASIASLSGIAAEELSPSDLVQSNPHFPVITWIVAEKA
jgi:SAM-dependent methyltransferase